MTTIKEDSPALYSNPDDDSAGPLGPDFGISLKCLVLTRQISDLSHAHHPEGGKAKMLFIVFRS